MENIDPAESVTSNENLSETDVTRVGEHDWGLLGICRESEMGVLGSNWMGGIRVSSCV